MLPPIVKNIIIINAILVFAQYVFGQLGYNLGDLLGLHYWQSPKFKWWQLLTHMFMHGDPNDLQQTILHIFSNMFALWMFGGTLENMWGPKRFLWFYLLCGFGAAFCHLGVLTYQYVGYQRDFIQYQAHPGFVEFAQFVKHHGLSGHEGFARYVQLWGQNTDCIDCGRQSIIALNQHYLNLINETTVGASGAVFGILFAFGYIFPNTLLYVYFAIPIKAKYFVGLYALFELYSGIRNSAGDNIAHFAHLGGMLFAFLLLSVWKKTHRNDFY